ncbi:SDR family NAD(P)-dependent oxidoreductase [Aquiflexum gelatinilyticum]|uniref:SDR family NAD(P)-dependent oxidoreductase n=1 Tax=Aquiflexum gelatinilyticum TaxID=2961943 RepID=A0A9X2PEU9_9BACT|nr:SDR family NAD(P)-dependent oxidoreductase [Aquiflexum gelatinilyticum]MCR9017440.1 SDR family NAD(P)-dependent oxidoreductase [Aquiflexum gelatinilyticum]
MSKGSLFIITGTSKGIGEALVRQVLQKNPSLVIGIARTKSQVSHSNYRHVICDLGDLKNLESKLDDIFPKGDFDQIVMINNAGIIGDIAHLGKLGSQSIRQIFEINTIAPTILMNAFVKKYARLEEVKKIVVNISSGAASKAIDGWAGYSASKAALNMLTQTAQNEADLDRNGIRFFAVAPGVVDTAMQQQIRNSSASDFSSLPKFILLKENMNLSSPEFAAEKILYLIENADKFEGVIQDVREF